MAIQKVTREKIFLGGFGRFLGSLHLARSRRHMIRGEKHIRRDIKKIREDAEKENIKKVAKDINKAGKDIAETLHGEEGILKETLKYTGQIEEDVQDMVKLFEYIAKGGFPPALTKEEAKKLVPMLQEFVKELSTDREVIVDLEKNAIHLLDRLRKVA